MPVDVCSILKRRPQTQYIFLFNTINIFSIFLFGSTSLLYNHYNKNSQTWNKETHTETKLSCSLFSLVYLLPVVYPIIFRASKIFTYGMVSSVQTHPYIFVATIFFGRPSPSQLLPVLGLYNFVVIPRSLYFSLISACFLGLKRTTGYSILEGPIEKKNILKVSTN